MAVFCKITVLIFISISKYVWIIWSLWKAERGMHSFDNTNWAQFHNEGFTLSVNPNNCWNSNDSLF